MFQDTVYVRYIPGTECRVTLGGRTQVYFFHYLLLMVVQIDRVTMVYLIKIFERTEQPQPLFLVLRLFGSQTAAEHVQLLKVRAHLLMICKVCCFHCLGPCVYCVHIKGQFFFFSECSRVFSR